MHTTNHISGIFENSTVVLMPAYTSFLEFANFSMEAWIDPAAFLDTHDEESL
jgi:hypothetical protein